MLFDFQQFSFSEEILEKYVKWFNDKRFVGILYEGTPKTKEEIRAWIVDCINDKSKQYFFVLQDNNLIGHIGLRGINFEKKYADIGSFFPNKRHWNGEPMSGALEFIIKEAQSLNLKLLTADFENEEDKKIELFTKVGFAPNPLSTHYLTLKL